jgi:hypothetical protein
MRNRKRFAILASFVLALGVGSGLRAGEQEGDKGETPEQKKLRGRTNAPAAADIDAGATLDALLAKQAKSAFSEKKGATIEGYVVQTEREEDGDYHLTLAAAKGETDTRKWLIVEVTPGWQKKDASLDPAALRKLQGSRVKVTGWLYYEPDEEQADPRGTRWEIHPVTAISAVK